MSVMIPKNVRQMGEPEEQRKIYVEDYVITYLKQYAKEEPEKSRGAILLGEAQEQEGTTYLFIRSALELGQDIALGNVPVFSDQNWLHIYEEIEKHFQGQEILGWFLSTPGFSPEITYDIQNIHRTHFSDKDKLLFLEDPIEGEEAFFVMSDGILTRQNGYLIFYERNEPMQQYMLEKKDGKSVDAEENFTDRAARSFRMAVQEKQEESGQKRVMTFLYGASTFLVLVVLVIGITMINNYEKMESVEQALNSLTQNLGEQTELAQTNASPADEIQTDEPQPESSDATESTSTTESEEVLAETVQTVPEQPDEEIQEAVIQPEESLSEEEEVIQPGVISVPQYYVVQKGDTLLGISQKIYGNDQYIQEICRLNQIDDSDRIFAGEKILLP